MKKLLLFSLIAVMSFWGLSCDSWVTTTQTITYVIDTLGSTDENIEVYWLDLTTNADYEEHRDNIRSVDQIAVVGEIINNLETVSRAGLWVATTDTLETIVEVLAGARRIFVLPEDIPGGVTTSVNWQEGLSYMENTEYLEGLIINEGAFAIYAMAEDAPFDMEVQAEIVITLTLGR